jgi:hypothetical protein
MVIVTSYSNVLVNYIMVANICCPVVADAAKHFFCCKYVVWCLPVLVLQSVLSCNAQILKAREMELIGVLPSLL